jgi:aryl sulfotransferase
MTDARFGWLVSYPKSGNTWLRMMLSSLFSGGAGVDINHLSDDFGVTTYAAMDEFLGIEASELTPAEIAAAQPGLHATILAYANAPIVWRKVHDRYWHTPGGQPVFPATLTRLAVYLVRDPRDVAVSFAHHRGSSVDQIIALMADPTTSLASDPERQKMQLPQPLGSWSQHVASWVDQGDQPVLTLRYEDLRCDPLAGLRAVIEHAGLHFKDARLRMAVDATRFDVLRAQEQAMGFRERRSASTAPFFRRGIAGGWVDDLSPEQQARISADHGNMMQRFGYL